MFVLNQNPIGWSTPHTRVKECINGWMFPAPFGNLKLTALTSIINLSTKNVTSILIELLFDWCWDQSIRSGGVTHFHFHPHCYTFSLVFTLFRLVPVCSSGWGTDLQWVNIRVGPFNQNVFNLPENCNSKCDSTKSPSLCLFCMFVYVFKSMRRERENVHFLLSHRSLPLRE